MCWESSTKQSCLLAFSTQWSGYPPHRLSVTGGGAGGGAGGQLKTCLCKGWAARGAS